MAVTIAVAVLLTVGVMAVWVSTVAFFRLRTPLERIHAVTLLNVAGGAPLVLAAVVSDGWSSRSLKCVFTLVLVLAGGALLSHAVGRALYQREGRRR